MRFHDEHPNRLDINRWILTVHNIYRPKYLHMDYTDATNFENIHISFEGIRLYVKLV